MEIGISEPDMLRLCVLVLFLLSCSDLSERERTQIDSSLKDSLINRTETWDFELSIIEDGLRRIEVAADFAVSMRSDSGAFTQMFGPLRIDIYDSTRSIEQTITCNELKYFSRDGRYYFYDNVQVKTREQKQLFCDYLIWSQNDRLISSPDFVTYISPGDSLSGYGYKGADDLSWYQLENVAGRVTMEEE
jgi:hypothetical protein